jgi:hypothetical protein
MRQQKCWFTESTCFGHKHAHRQEYNGDFRILVGPRPLNSTQITAQRYTTQTAFQVWTPKSGTHYFTPDDGHTCARNMLSQQTNMFCRIWLFFILHNI